MLPAIATDIIAQDAVAQERTPASNTAPYPLGGVIAANGN